MAAQPVFLDKTNTEIVSLVILNCSFVISNKNLYDVSIIENITLTTCNASVSRVDSSILLQTVAIFL